MCPHDLDLFSVRHIFVPHPKSNEKRQCAMHQLTGTTFTEYRVIFGSCTFPSLPACIGRIFILRDTPKELAWFKQVRYRKYKNSELYLLWAMEYFNERIFTFLTSYAESRILGALNLKQSKHNSHLVVLKVFILYSFLSFRNSPA